MEKRRIPGIRKGNQILYSELGMMEQIKTFFMNFYKEYTEEAGM